MSIIREALEFLTNLGVESADVQEVILPGRKKMVILPGEEAITIDVDRPSHDDKVRSLESLVAWCLWRNDGHLIECFISDGSIAISMNRIESIHDKAVLVLRASAEMTAVIKLIAAPVSQRDLISLLRGPLFNGVPPGVLQVFRAITFKSSATAVRDKESLGRNVEKAVAARDGDIPETITVDLVVFDLPDDLPKIRIALNVDVDFDSERFVFQPVGNAIADVTQTSLKTIRSVLEEALPEGSLVINGQGS